MALPILNAMHFTALQSLRFLFLLLIFLSHYSFAGIPPLDAGGDCGVAFFFILSGFITAHSRGRQIEEDSYSHRKFLTSRFLKLYPLHLLCLGAALIIQWKNHNMDAALPLLTNLLLIQSYVPLPEYYFSGNGVSWFLSTLFLMYLLFPFLYRWMVLSPRRQMASWLMLWGLAYSTIWHFTPDNLANNILYVSPPVRLTDFIIGLLLYRLYRSPQLSPFLSFQRRSFITCIECIAIALVWGCLLIAPDIPVKFRTSLWFFPGSIFIILCFSRPGHQGGKIHQWLSHRSLQTLGNLSFELFLTHQLTILTINHFLHPTALPYPIAFAITLITALGVAKTAQVMIAHTRKKYLTNPE